MVERHGSVACVTLARPEKANAMDAEITDALLGAVRAVRDDADVRAMVLTGRGSAFSAGGHFETIRAMRDDRPLRDAVLAAHQELFWVMTHLPFPTVAAVNGAAVGAGVTVALLCDLVVMAEDTFLSDPRVSLGLLDGAGGLVLWPLLTSLSAAKEHLFLGDRVSGVEAHRLGLANRAVPASDVLDEALQLAKRLSALPPQAVRQTRQLLNFHIDQVAAILPQCARAESECFDTEEHRMLLERLSARVAAKTARTR
ncbi:enoyl-CoA hydratase/isomerase family protein [Mycobacterium avium]|uniref:enoyl-CoA hydratase/isomerase family protein n=1 Tax=Mycobacterium avium TaxID=1764 RepID=UPI0022AB85F3|nr:enoyl-CoA hydratase/isomerase family protein [Mycobacterium avium]